MTMPSFMSTVAVWVLVVGAPHLLGGATAEMEWLIAAGATVACGAVLAHAIELERKGFVVPALGVALMLQLATLVQGLPLPCKVIASLAPTSASLQASAAQLVLHEAPRLCTLSFDHGATWAALGWTSTVVATLIACALYVQLGGRQSLLAAVAVSCALVAVSALTHRLGGFGALYGMYRPIYAHSRTLGPFLNENHLGAFIAFGVPTMIALGLEHEERASTTLWFGAAALCTGTAILTLSRGAFAMLLFELMLLASLVFVRRRNTGTQLRVTLVSVVGSLALGVYVAGDALFQEFSAGDTGKLEMAAKALSFSLSVQPWGAGRGAFGSAFSTVYGSTSRPQFAENLLAQWVVDWGWPVTLAALFGLGWWFFRALVNARTTIQAAGLISLAALALQNQVDFNLELPGAVVVATALFVVTVIPSRRQVVNPIWLEQRLASGVTTRWCIGAATLGFVGTALCVWAGVTDTSFDSLYRRVQSRSGSEALLAEVKRAVARHPADGRFALLGASVATAIADPEAGLWIQQARRLAPGWAGSYALQAHRDLARGELAGAVGNVRAFLERDPMASHDLACRVVAAWSGAGGAMDKVLPEGPESALISDRLAACELLPVEAREKLDDIALERAPDSWKLRLRLARRPSTPPARVIDLLSPLVDAGNLDAMTYGTLANAYDALGKPAQAYAVLKRGLPRTTQPYLLHHFLAVRYGRDRRVDEMRDALGAMRAVAVNDGAALADAYARDGNVEMTYGDPRNALAAFEKAYRLAPRRELLLALLGAASRTGDQVKLTWVRGTLCRQGDTSYCTQPPSYLTGGPAP